MSTVKIALIGGALLALSAGLGFLKFRRRHPEGIYMDQLRAFAADESVVIPKARIPAIRPAKVTKGPRQGLRAFGVR